MKDGALGALLTVAAKELVDGVRDRRSLMSALLFPLFGPVLIALMLFTIARNATTNEPLQLPVAGAERAPSLVEFLESNGVIVVDPPADPAAAVRDGTVPVVLVVPETFPERFRAGRSAEVELILDRSRAASRDDIARARKVLRAWSGQIATLRLLARGISPELLQPIDLDEVELSNPQKRAANLLDTITMFVVLSAFVCNMYLAIDATAGERERGSLEPLLITPIRREVVVVGKWLATVCFGVFGVMLSLLFTTIALGFVPLEEVGLRISLGPAVALRILLTLIPLALLAGALQLYVASFARSFKEAQTYLSLLLFVPMMPGLAMTLNPVETADWMMLVPALGHQLLVTDMLRGDPIDIPRHLLALGSAAVLTAGFLAATTWLFKREAIVFGK